MSTEQISSHFEARDSIDAIMAAAFKEIGKRARNGGTTEFEIQQWVIEAFQKENLVTNSPPMVAVSPDHWSRCIKAPLERPVS